MKRLLLCLLLLCLGASGAMAQPTPEDTPVTDPAVAKVELEKVLADPEFLNATKPSFMEQMGLWLYAWFESMDTDLRAYEFIGQLTRISYVLMWIILIASFLCLAYWSIRVFKRRHWQDQDNPADDMLHAEAGLLDGTEIIHPELNSGQLTVRKMLDKWREFFNRVQARGLTPSLAARTNREAVRLLPAEDGLRDELGQLSDIYDRHVFGDYPLDDEAAREWLQHLEAAEARLAQKTEDTP